jgi:hypothetical protein
LLSLFIILNCDHTKKNLPTKNEGRKGKKMNHFFAHACKLFYMIASYICFLAFLKEFFTFLFLAIENWPISQPNRLANQENHLVSRSKPVCVQPTFPKGQKQKLKQTWLYPLSHKSKNLLLELVGLVVESLSE